MLVLDEDLNETSMDNKWTTALEFWADCYHFSMHAQLS